MMGKGFALAAIALAGFLFSLTPVAARLDDALLDLEWVLLRKFAPKPAPDDILIVGVDEMSVRTIDAPPGLWHEPIGLVLERIAAAKPRAIGIDLALPERSYENFHPGLDRPLLRGLAAARLNGPLVASLSIDSRTHSARVIHAPVLAVLGDQGLGIGLLGRDADGTTRRFSLAVPTEDGAYPTLSGRLCRALARRCSDGLIDYALGPPFKYVSIHDVLTARDDKYLEKLFRDRVAFIGDVRQADRVEVPVNLAGWDLGGRLTPSVVVHAQSLRTALAGAPTEGSRPLSVLILTLAALVALVKETRMALATALLASIVGIAATTFALRANLYVGVSAAIFTLFAAALASRWIGRLRF